MEVRVHTVSLINMNVAALNRYQVFTKVKFIHRK